MHNNINSLIKIAKTLDSNGYYKEADQIQDILNVRFAGGLRFLPNIVDEGVKLIPRLVRPIHTPRTPLHTTPHTPPVHTPTHTTPTHTPTHTTPPSPRGRFDILEIDDIPPVTHTTPVTVEDAVDAARVVDRAVEDVSVADARRLIHETHTEDLARDVARYEPEFVEEVIEDLRRGRRVEVTDRTRRIYEFGKRMRLFNPEQLKNIDRLHDFTGTHREFDGGEELITPPKLINPPDEELIHPPKLIHPPIHELETPPRLKTPPIKVPPKIPPPRKPELPDLPFFDLPLIFNPGDGKKSEPIKGGYYYEPEGT